MGKRLYYLYVFIYLSIGVCVYVCSNNTSEIEFFSVCRFYLEFDNECLVLSLVLTLLFSFLLS